MCKVLFSACLLGEMVRYHGKDALCMHQIIDKWQKENRIISICPEVAAGLPVPRPPCEIIGGMGVDVINGTAKVISNTGINRTDEFILGAYKALELVKIYAIKVAVLKSRSPSCGNKQIYDGSYSGRITNGFGVTAWLLTQKGVKVFNENELDEADKYVQLIEKRAD